MGRLVQLWEMAASKSAHVRWYDLSVAVAALMVEAMRMDGEHDRLEHDEIARLLGDRFTLESDRIEQLIAEADCEVNRELDPDLFANAIRHGFVMEERIDILTDLWHVVLSDGKVVCYEEQLLRRIAELLDVDEAAFASSRLKAEGDLSA